MNLWNVYKDGRICVNHFTFKIICIKTSQWGHFSLQTTFAIGFRFIPGLVNFQVFFIFLKINGCELIQDIHSKGIYRPVPEGWILFQKKLKENADVICIGNSGFSCGTRFNGTKEIPAKWRQGFQNITKPQGIFNVSLFVVGDFFIHEKFSFSK